MNTLKKYGPTVVAILSGVFGIIKPEVLSAHPQIVATYVALLGTINHWMQSPNDVPKGA